MKPNPQKDAYKARKKTRKSLADIDSLRGTVEGLLIARYCEMKLTKKITRVLEESGVK